MLAGAARTIVLYHLDRGWADHLAVLAEIREGIHLRALGTGALGGSRDPLGDFQAEAVKLFTSLLDRVQEESAETFRTASITEAGVDLDAAGLQAADGDLDLRGAGQPVRHRPRPGHAQACPPEGPSMMMAGLVDPALREAPP